MKRIIALVLVLCMTLGMVVTVSAAPGAGFSRTLNLVRLIRTMFAKDEEDAPAIGQLDKGILTVYVSANGKSGADGTAKNPFATIEAARDAIRDVNKSGLKGITVLIKSGEYRINDTIVFTEEDSGTEKCPITYLGEDGTILCGGVSFTSTAFKKADGSLVEYFPAEARDKIVSIDLKEYGFTVDQIAKLLAKTVGSYQANAPVVAVNGKNMTLARFPNDEWIEMEHGQFYDANGNPTQYTDNDRHIPKDQQAHTTRVEYGDDYFETVTSWHSYEDIFVEGRFTHLWVHDNSEIQSINYETDEVTVPYSGAYFPNDGGLLYFYNIPEELDMPGEYIVDRDCILYYYPEENFETARFTMAVLDKNMIELDSDYITFDNLTLESGRKNGINGSVNNATIQNCIVRDFMVTGINIVGGYNNYIYSNEVYSIGGTGIDINEAGDRETLAKSNTIVCNNYVHDYGFGGIIEYAILYSGCGVTVCHNECCDSNTLAMDNSGPYHLTEYNYIHDIGQFFSDGGAIGSGGSHNYGSIFRYNYLENIGTAEYPTVTQLGVQAFTVDCDANGLTIYSNIINKITGSGVGVSGGRDNNVHNNLFISCGFYAYSLDARDYNDFKNAGVAATCGVTEYLLSDTWQAAFSELRGLHGNYDPENPLDPMFEGAPGGNRFVDNYGYFDKANRLTNYIGNYTFLYYDDEIINATSEIFAISAENGNMKTYNSRRNGDIVIADALAEAEAAGYPIMTVEQFNQIGRIGVGPNASK
ncbi:MAG: right-handed parallel beta-helix repeat-containing protein [Ruminococcaceae bacterium]|nr:right-handed parallel beta-helix repeat-containing protein [Oscillospiraceae bacterium]